MLEVTVLYYTEVDLRLADEVLQLEQGDSERIELPEGFKQGKQILAVMEGRCRILSRLGDRVLPFLAENSHTVEVQSS